MLSLPVFLCIRLRVGEKQNLISLPPPPLTPFSPFLTYFPFLPLRPDISGINKKWFLLPPLSLASSGLLPGSLGGRKLTILHTTQRKGRSSQAGERRGEGINRPRNGWLLFHYIAPLPSQLKPRPWLEVVSIDDAPAVYKRALSVCALVCWESEEGSLRTRELR